jgi:hypothetical protein
VGSFDLMSDNIRMSQGRKGGSSETTIRRRTKQYEYKFVLEKNLPSQRQS